MTISSKPIQKGSLYIQNKNENTDIKVGFITSAVKSFNLNKFIGIGYINRDYRKGEEVYTKDRKERKLILNLKKVLLELNYYRKIINEPKQLSKIKYELYYINNVRIIDFIYLMTFYSFVLF